MRDTPARAICAEIITRWLETRDFPERMLPEKHPERALIQEIVYGVCRWKLLLETIIEKLVSRPPDPQAAGFLMTGLYQIFLMDNIPPHAAANETVEAAKSVLDRRRAGFINAILRASLRKKAELDAMLENQSLAVRLSHPEILVKRWSKTYGRKTAAAICNWNNTRPSVTLRVNTMRTSSRDYLKQLHEAGIEKASIHPADTAQRFITLPSGISIPRLPGYRDGLFVIQDPATMLAVDLLKLNKSGLRLLDACAAPGGKTFACAEQMGDKGLIIAADLHSDRREQLRKNARRMKFSCIKTRKVDAAKKGGLSHVLPFAPYDRILLDVPCSNTGVLRRHPDARWRFSEKRQRKLMGLQTRILNACAHMLADDGIMVYSTCSLEPEENLQRIESWLKLNQGFRISGQAVSIPPESGMDGAFAVAIVHK
jgi:16S rRNA (cytosine967-C5)-methyltransferase